MNTGAVLNRINFGNSVSLGRVAGISVSGWPTALALRGASAGAMVDGLVSALFQGEVSSDTRGVLMSGSNPVADRLGAARTPPKLAAPTLAELIGLSLGAPEFQRH